MAPDMIESRMAEPLPKPLPEDSKALEEAVEAARKSLAEGRGVPYEDVRRWLLSWGSDQELPPPECE
jgi:hypothetical protein